MIVAAGFMPNPARIDSKQPPGTRGPAAVSIPGHDAIGDEMARLPVVVDIVAIDADCLALGERDEGAVGVSLAVELR